MRWLALQKIGSLMTTSSICSDCQAPTKQLWVPSSSTPDFIVVHRGDWISLEQCASCKSFWVEVPYEPYASFPYRVLWTKSADEWKSIYAVDRGKTLHKWHSVRIRQLAHSLTREDKEAVEWHRVRSYGRTPFDIRDDGILPDLDKLNAK